MTLFLHRQHEARRDWLALLERAVAIGDQVAQGTDIDKASAIDFAGLTVRVGDQRFPLPYASAASAKEGFRHLARGFITAAQPELRRALALAMAQAARCCRRMLEIADDEAQAATRRRLAED